MGSRGSLRGDGAGGRERERLEAWNKGAGAWGGSLWAWGAGAWTENRTDVLTFVRLDVWSDGWTENTSTLSPSGPLPKKFDKSVQFF